MFVIKAFTISGQNKNKYSKKLQNLCHSITIFWTPKQVVEWTSLIFIIKRYGSFIKYGTSKK